MQDSLLRLLQNSIIPNQCIICHKLHIANLCADCISKIPNKPTIWIHQHIQQKSLFAPKTYTTIQPNLIEGNLMSILSCTPFHNSIIRKSIHYLKYKNIPQLAEPLGAIMLRTLTQHIRLKSHIILCPIPLHPKRLQFRGYNQSLLLAEYIAQKLKLPLYLDLERIRNTPHQMRIRDKQDRIDNMKSSFKAHTKSQKDTTIILIDDVTTTLSTIQEAAKALYKQGFHDIHALVLAH
jgi:ComF family protein